MTKSIPLFAVLALAVSCGKDAPQPSGAASLPPSAYALAAEPAGAVSVLAAMAAAPKDDVVVVGRVREITPGLAAFTLTDDSLDYCGRTEMEGCEKPWDYCCHPSDEIAKNTVAVLVKDGKGDPVAAARLPELRNLDLVVVKGRLVKDKAGNVELEATGWYRKERPTLPAETVFPQ